MQYADIYDLEVVANEIKKKQNAVPGKGLSTNDYTDADKDIVDGVTSALAGKVDKETGKSLIDLTTVVDGASYDSANHLILFKNGSTTLFSLDAAAFVKDGMVDTVEITGGNLVITFNTDAGKQAISIPLTDIFDPSNYYDKTATDNLLADKADDTSVYKTFSFGNTGSGGGTVKYIELTGAYPNNVAKENSYMITGRNGESAILVLPTGMAIGVYSDPRLLYLTRGTSTPIVSVNLDSTNGKVYVGIGSYTYIHISQIGGERTNWSGEIITELPSGATTVAIVSDVANKADKVASATNGNFAGLDANGNLTDSGKSAADFATPENVETSASAQGALLRDTVGWTGKNLLQNTATSKTANGVTFTVNSDGSVTANGTATESTWVYVTRTFKKGRYIINGCPSGGATSGKYYVRVQATGGGSPDVFDIGNGAEFEVTDETQQFYVYLAQVGSGYTASNLTFYPMIRRADIADDTYEPYHESVETMYEEEVHGVNLLKGTIESGELSNGVTLTVSGNTVLTLNGTPTANGGKTLMTIREGDILKDGETYVISDGGSSSYYGAYIYLNGLKKSDSSTDYDIVRLQDKSTFTADFTTYSRYTFGIYVRTDAGTLSNKKFYLMLRKATIEDGTYRPYNRQAIQNQIDAQGVLGAKNLFNFDTPTVTSSGVTFENDGGIITANGTGTNVGFPYIECRKTLPAGTYILTGCPSGGGDVANPDNYQIILRLNDPTGSIIALDYGNGSTFTLDQSSVVSMRCMTSKNMTVTNLIYKPMIRLASDPDDTYQPYAMTNKELTDRVIQSVVSVNRDTATTNSGTIRLYRYGNLRILTGNFNPSVAGTSATNTHIADLPLATDYPTYSVISVCGRGETDSSATAKIGNVNIGTDGIIKYQGQATGENMFFNIAWVVG